MGGGFVIVSSLHLLLGFGNLSGITKLWYFLLIFFFSGIFQSVGWPLCVAVMTNWYPKKGRGTIFGVWAANVNLGNIFGTLVCTFCIKVVHFNWEWTWIVLNVMLGVIGVLNLLFLVSKPKYVGLQVDEDDEVVTKLDESKPEKGISFWKAWCIPGVIAVSICYLGLKLANYSIMLWLPKYASNYLHFDTSLKALIAIIYDVGTITGSFVLGFISDLLWGKRIIVSFIGLILAAAGHVLLIIEM